MWCEFKDHIRYQLVDSVISIDMVYKKLTHTETLYYPIVLSTLNVLSFWYQIVFGCQSKDKKLMHPNDYHIELFSNNFQFSHPSSHLKVPRFKLNFTNQIIANNNC